MSNPSLQGEGLRTLLFGAARWLTWGRLLPAMKIKMKIRKLISMPLAVDI
jgi:hypothetical protein